MADLMSIIEQRRLPSPTVTPQALAWDGTNLWLSSRDLGTLYKIDVVEWRIAEEIDPPGVVWAGVATNGSIHFTIGKGLNDDRYIYRYTTGQGFTKLFTCPDFTGSYLGYDGDNLYLSQWYEQRILKLDSNGKTIGRIDVGAEICGYVFANGAIYVLRGTENIPRPAYVQGPATPAHFSSGAKEGQEQWWLARIDVRRENAQVEDLATIPFAARSLTFDGKNFWSNHRAANETISFSLPL